MRYLTKLTQEEIDDILNKHQDWIDRKDTGERADFSNCYLKNVNFNYANLEGAIFNGAFLHNATFEEGALIDTSFDGAYLQGAKFFKTEVSDASFENAILRNADMRYAYMPDCYFTNADLNGADLSGADFSGSCFNCASLDNVTFCHTNLAGIEIEDCTFNNADDQNNELDVAIPMACPRTGDFIGWKAVRQDDHDFIVKLQIPIDAKRSSAFSNKCRAQFVKTLDIICLDADICTDSVVNKAIKDTIYRKGELTFPDSWDECRWNECSNGIHFFMTIDEACAYAKFFTLPKKVHPRLAFGNRQISSTAVLTKEDKS